ncbi:hypothetical protein J2Y03_005575 [Neobacillus niacini]|nr:hypothetical protein [Neobacillus niacini]
MTSAPTSAKRENAFKSKMLPAVPALYTKKVPGTI